MLSLVRVNWFIQNVVLNTGIQGESILLIFVLVL